MIGGVKPRTFKNDANRRIDFAQGFLATLWTARQRGIAKFLIALKLHSAVFTPVGINRHINNLKQAFYKLPQEKHRSHNHAFA